MSDHLPPGGGRFSITSEDLEILGHVSEHILRINAPLAQGNLVAAGPDELVSDIMEQAKTTPGSTTIVQTPPQEGEPNAPPKSDLEQLSALREQVEAVEALVSVVTAFCIYNEHPAPYDISDSAQKREFISAIAKWRTNVMAGNKIKAIASYLDIKEATSTSFKKSVKSADLHLEFLIALFSTMGFEGAELRELDGLLTARADQIRELHLKLTDASDTFDHVVTYYYFEKLPGTGENGVPSLFGVNIRLFFLKMSQSLWQATMNKSSVQSVDLAMEIFDFKVGLLSSVVASDLATIRAASRKMCGKTDDEIKALMDLKSLHKNV